MATAESVKAKLQNLIALANNTTGNTDADLTTAVNALIAGFGSGGDGGGVQIGDNTTTPNMLNLFYALETGNAVTGEFTLADVLPNTETLIFDSGLLEIKGIFYVDCDYAYTATGSVPEYAVWGLYMANPDGLENVKAVGISTYGTGGSSNGFPVGCGGFICRGTPRIDSGALYVAATFNRNTSYTPFMSGHRYKWVAW